MTTALNMLAAALAARGLGPNREGRFKCPAHGGADFNLSVRQGRSAVVVRCWSHGCTAADIAASLGLRVADLFDDARPSEPWRMPTPPRPVTAAPRAEHRLEAGVPNRWGPGTDPIDGALHVGADHRHAASFRYLVVSPAGEDVLVGVVDRFEPLVPGLRKTFRQRRPDPRGGWLHGLGGGTLPLYGLVEALERGEGVPLVVAEGEKTVEALRAAGWHAVSASGGADGWRAWHDDQLVQLTAGAGEDTHEPVTLWPDDDAPGDGWLARMRATCERLGIPAVEVAR